MAFPYDPATLAQDVIRDILRLRPEVVAQPIPFGTTPTVGARPAGHVFVDPQTMLELRRADMTAARLAAQRPPPEPAPLMRFTPPGFTLSDVEPIPAAFTRADVLPLLHPEAPRAFELINPAEGLRLEHLRRSLLNPIRLDRVVGPRPIISGLLAGLAPEGAAFPPAPAEQAEAAFRLGLLAGLQRNFAIPLAESLRLGMER